MKVAMCASAARPRAPMNASQFALCAGILGIVDAPLDWHARPLVERIKNCILSGLHSARVITDFLFSNLHFCMRATDEQILSFFGAPFALDLSRARV